VMLVLVLWCCWVDGGFLLPGASERVMWPQVACPVDVPLSADAWLTGLLWQRLFSMLVRLSS
jgi:hypothetical protein